MQRINTPNKAVDQFGIGKHGYQGGNPATNTPATQLDPAPLNAMQEEIANVIELSGQALNPAINTQLHDAVARISASPPAPPLSANGGEAVTAAWVRAQLNDAGKNADGLIVRKGLPIGTNPFSIVENFDGDFNSTGSPNIPGGLTNSVRLQVSRHSLTSNLPVSANGQYLYASYKITSAYSSLSYECNCITDPATGVKSYTPWVMVTSATGITGAGAGAGAGAANPLKFVTFNGFTGTVIQSSGIASLVKLGLGHYTATFTTAAPTANYGVIGQSSTASICVSTNTIYASGFTRTTTTCTFFVQSFNQSLVDDAEVTVAFPGA